MLCDQSKTRTKANNQQKNNLKILISPLEDNKLNIALELRNSMCITRVLDSVFKIKQVAM